MEHKRFWLFFLVILLVIVGLLLVFVFTAKDDKRNNGYDLGGEELLDSPRTFVLNENETYQERDARELEEAYQRALGIGITIKELSFVESFTSLNNVALTTNNRFKDNDEIIIYYVIDNIGPGVKELNGTQEYALDFALDMKLLDPDYNTVEWFNSDNSFRVQKPVAQDTYHTFPFLITANVNDFDHKGIYTIEVTVRNIPLKQRDTKTITFEIR